ncbi:hypothetical protein D3C77_366780 [compost metagenome]
MIHIIAKQIAAAGEFNTRHRLDAFRADERPRFIADLHPARHLAIGYGILDAVVSDFLHRRNVQIAENIFAARRLVRNPGSIRIACQHRQCVRIRYGGPSPGRSSIEQRAHARLFRQPPQLCQMSIAACAAGHKYARLVAPCVQWSTAMHKFIFQLYADDRPALTKESAFNLTGNLPVKPPHVLQIQGIVGADFERLSEHPIRNSAVAQFTVAERPDSQNQRQLKLRAQVYEMPQTAAPAPIEPPLLLFVKNPKHIRGHDSDSARFHFEQLFLPLQVRKTGIMEFTDNRNVRLPILSHIKIRKTQLLALRANAAILPQLSRANHFVAAIQLNPF